MDTRAFQPGKYLTFRIRGQHFAIDSRWVRAILPVDQLHPVAKATAIVSPTDRFSGPAAIDPTLLLGHAVSGGQRIPVIDLARRLDLHSVASGREPFIVVIDVSGGDGLPQPAGFIADRVSEIVKARERDFREGKLRMGRPRRVLWPEEILTLDEVEAVAS